jgi:hypothetical protein
LIYFDEEILSHDSHINGPGVDFGFGATPNLFPCSCDIDPQFVTTQSFEKGDLEIMGIDPDEWLTVVMTLDGGATFADVLEDLTGPDLRMGLVAGDFCGDECCECCFVNNPIPIPGAVWLLTSGLLGLVGLRRRFRG